jgi:hypothetical protein
VAKRGHYYQLYTQQFRRQLGEAYHLEDLAGMAQTRLVRGVIS